MRGLSSITALAFCWSAARAIYTDEAFKSDFHHALLGQPLPSTTFHAPHAASKATLIYTITDRGVVAAVNPKDGAVVWRHILRDIPFTASPLLRIVDNQSVVITGLTDHLQAWNIADGKAVWSSQFPSESLQDLQVLQPSEAGSAQTKRDILALYDGVTPSVRRINAKDGSIIWQYNGKSGDKPLRIAVSDEALYCISTKAFTSGTLKLKATTLNLSTGTDVATYTVPSDSDLEDTKSILYVGASASAPLLAWTDKSLEILRIHFLGTKKTLSLPLPKKGKSETKSVTFHATTHMGSSSHFLLAFEDGVQNWAEVYSVDFKSFTVKKAYALPAMDGAAVFTVTAVQSKLYLTRISREEITITTSESDKVIANWKIKDPNLPSSLQGSHPISAVTEIALKSDLSVALRAAISLSNGHWVLLRYGRVEWVRPEVLSDAVDAIMSPPPLNRALVKEAHDGQKHNFVAVILRRVNRHMLGLRRLFTSNIFLSSSLFSGSSGQRNTREKYHSTAVVVVITSTGKIVGIESGNLNKILWTVDLSLPFPSFDFEKARLRLIGNDVVEIGSHWTKEQIYIRTDDGQVVSTNSKELRKSNASFSLKSPAIFYKVDEAHVKGFNTEDSDDAPVWQISTSENEEILLLCQKPAEESVASIGIVLGDRRVLYKHLNPNIALLLTSNRASDTLTAHLIDLVTGTIIHSAKHAGVDLSRPIAAAASENWIVYSFTTFTDVSESKGPQLVVTDLYDSSIPDDHGQFGNPSNFSSLDLEGQYAAGASALPYIVSQSYILPEEISQMKFTQTEQGITTRQLVATLPQSNAIIGIPRAAVDPRRPVGRDPTSAEAMEGLTRYTVFLSFNPQWFLSHRRVVVGVRKLLTFPSVYESTSLVLAVGLDVFWTSSSPSSSFDMIGEGFNRAQMLVTVFGLFLVVLVLQSLVQRKQLNMIWRTS